MLTTPHREARPLRRRSYGPVTILLAVLLVLYWASLFTATHVPLPRGVLRHGGDKLAHFLAYGGLAALMMSVRASHGPFGWRSVIGRFIVLVAYGAFDELTQLLVRRQADWWDWMADVVGVAIGLSLVAGIAWRRPHAEAAADPLQEPT